MTDSTHAQASEVLEWLKQGVALRAQGQHEAALGAYQKAVALPGAPAAVFFNLGNVLLDLGVGRSLPLRWSARCSCSRRWLRR